MGERFGNGGMVAMATAPQQPHEGAAQAWAMARTRLIKARAAMNEADHELSQAQQVETETWAALEVESERSTTPTPTARIPR